MNGMKQTTTRPASRTGRGRAGADPARHTAAQRRRRAGERTALPEIPQTDMTPQVRSAVMGLMDELDRLKDELTAAHERVSLLENMADEDPLVPVLNRRGFVRELERALAYVKRYGTEASLIYIDLDDFKAINDAHGHAAGDAALRHVAALLIENVRRSDLVGRLGGDEFALVLHRAGLEVARSKALRLVEDIAARPFSHDGAEIGLALSVGSTDLRDGDTVADVLDRADREMFRHKTGRKRRTG